MDRENSVMLATKVSTSFCKDPSPVSGTGACDRASAIYNNLPGNMEHCIVELCQPLAETQTVGR